MGEDEQIRIVIDIEVHDIERFKQAAQRCVEVSRQEPGTLVYDWYLDEERGVARLYEVYASVDALRAHTVGPVFSEAGLPLMDVSTFVHLDVYGDAGSLRDEIGRLWPATEWGVPFASLREPRLTEDP